MGLIRDLFQTSISIDAKKNDPGKISRPQSPLKEPKYQFEHGVDDWASIFIGIWEKTIVYYEYDESGQNPGKD